MAHFQFAISQEKIQKMLFGGPGTEVLMEALMGQFLKTEMTGHIGAAPGRANR